MSKEDPVDREFVFDVIKVLTGFIVLMIVAFMLQSWENQREEIIASSSTPGAGMYVLIPIIVGILTFGITAFVQGGFSLAEVIFTRARQNQVD